MQITSPLTYLVFLLQSAYYHRGRLGNNYQMLLLIEITNVSMLFSHVFFCLLIRDAVY